MGERVCSLQEFDVKMSEKIHKYCLSIDEQRITLANEWTEIDEGGSFLTQIDKCGISG